MLILRFSRWSADMSSIRQTPISRGFLAFVGSIRANDPRLRCAARHVRSGGRARSPCARRRPRATLSKPTPHPAAIVDIGLAEGFAKPRLLERNDDPVHDRPR